VNAGHDDDCFLSGGDDGLFPCICKSPVQIQKCSCGHPSCNQYTLSTQGGVGFSLEDATLYAAAETMRAALEAVKAEGMANHNTRCRDWWPLVLAAIDAAQGTSGFAQDAQRLDPQGAGPVRQDAPETPLSTPLPSGSIER
jgi:hypothetical protein